MYKKDSDLCSLETMRSSKNPSWYRVLTIAVLTFTLASFLLSAWLRANEGVVQIHTSLTAAQYVGLVRRGVSAPPLLDRPHHFSLEQSDQFCATQTPKSGEKHFVFMMIVSSWENSDRRDHIRKTWATYDWFKNSPELSYGYKFIISQPSPDKEYKTRPTDLGSPDILIADHLAEHYYLLDLKVMWGFSRVLSTHNFDYILKCDDDTFVNLWKLPSRVLGSVKTDYFYGGKVLGLQEPWSWNGENIAYASGSGYVLSRRALCAVVVAHAVYSLDNPRIPIEDAYTGVLNARMGIPLTGLKGFATDHESCKNFDTVIFHHIHMKLFGRLLKAAVNGTHFC